MHMADEDSEVRLMVEIDDELGEVSKVDYDEVSEGRWWDESVTMSWMRIVKSIKLMSWIRLAWRESQYSRESETDEWR